MLKEAFFSPDFLAPDEGNRFTVQPDIENRLQTSPHFTFQNQPYRNRFIVISPDGHGLSAIFRLGLSGGRNRVFPRGSETYAPFKLY